MSPVKKIIHSVSTVALLTGLALNFNACSEQSPLASGSNEVQDSISLSKKAQFPQFASMTLGYVSDDKGYQGGNMNVPGGSIFRLDTGALTPPPGTPTGADVTLTMLVEKNEDANNELIFTFGPHGSQFTPSAEIWLDWNELGSEIATLYYIDENGNYIPQEPDDVDVQGKKMKLFVDHFSRYAIGAE